MYIAVDVIRNKRELKKDHWCQAELGFQFLGKMACHMGGEGSDYDATIFPSQFYM